MIKAVFFDIDGTLLSFKTRTTPPSTVAALARLRQNGVKTFIATGRPPCLLPELTRLLPPDWDGYVTLNGQYCYDDAGVYRSQPLPVAGLQGLLDYLAGPGADLCVSFAELNRMYLNQISPACADLAKGLAGLEGNTVLGNPADCLRNPTYQLNLYADEAREQEALAHMPGCRAVRWCDAFDDIIPADGGKAVGLQAALDRYGLTRAECAAFGDGGNDVEMLQYAGVGVAMGNAAPAVQAAADYTTAHVDENGIEQGLQHLGLI